MTDANRPCRRCGHINTHVDRFISRWHWLSRHCDRCFANLDTGHRGVVELFALSQFFVLRLLVAAGLAGIPLTIAYVLLVPGSLDHSPAVRATILAVPTVLVALVLWRRRVGK